LSGPSLDLVAPIRPLQLCADGGYQLRLEVLRVPLIMVPDNMQEIIHKNTQAIIVILASLRGDEYNKVSGLDNTKDIWDTLKVSHERNDITMITKMGLVEGEVGRFAMKRGEETTKTLLLLLLFYFPFFSYFKPNSNKI
jgi:hypothetical protein